VRYLGDNVLAFRFKQNDMIAATIRDFGMPETIPCTYTDDLLPRNGDLLPLPSFNWDHRVWLVPVYRHNIAAITSFIQEYHFGADQAVLGYLRLARESRNRPSAFAIIEDIILANVCDHPLLAGWVTEVSDGTPL